MAEIKLTNKLKILTVVGERVKFSKEILVKVGVYHDKRKYAAGNGEGNIQCYSYRKIH